MRRTFILLLSLFLASCGGEVGPQGPQGPKGPQGATGQPATDGTRLKQQVAVSADGARFPMGIWDSQRKEACSFILADDGQLRCLPEAWEWPGYYADASCTQLLFFVTAGCSGPTYGDMASGACQSGHQRLSLTPIATPAGNVAYIYDGCQKTTITGGPFDYFIATPIAATEFAAAQIQTE